ncbi:polymorphic toxin type 15 domain-containing protein [Tepidibacter sp. Z1-5]|uniref:polymorphic toxin type 15 domain-containing protein n=1 Tax=Tepidibacter sp. Z1-5 TaxID=3134138 RepID=UPI0030C0C5F8
MSGFLDIKIKSRFNIVNIEDINISHTINEHGKLYLRCIVENINEVEDHNYCAQNNTLSEIISTSFKDKIQVYNKDEVLFTGFVDNLEIEMENGVYYIIVKAISSTILLDIKKRTRSFQDKNTTYIDIVDIMKKNYASFICNPHEKFKTPIGKPIIQYQETDFEFLKRLSSMFNDILVCDTLKETPHLHLGYPKGNTYDIKDNLPYKAYKNIELFNKNGGSEKGFNDTDFFYYEIETYQRYKLGDKITFKSKDSYVTSVDVNIVKGELIYKYILSQRKSIRQNTIFNDKIKGASIEGQVLSVSGETLKVHLSLDKNQDKEKAHDYIYSPVKGNSLYSMPQVGSHTNLYFPTNKEEDAFCDSCVRKNAKTCSELHNPNNRYFRSEHGNKLSIKPDSIKLQGATKEPLSISLDENEGIQILSNKSITLTAKDSIEFNTPKKINIKAETKLVAQKTKSETALYIEGSHNFLGADIVPRATQRETYEPYNDDEPEVAPEKPFNLLELMGNVVAAVATVAVIGIAAVATVATFGLGAAIGIGLVAGALSLISAATKPKALTDAIFDPEYPIDGATTTGAMGYFKEEVEEPTMLSVVGNFLGGVGDGVTDMVTGIYDMCRHPIRTAQGFGQILRHPFKTVTAIGLTVGKSFVDDVIYGDANSRARFLGRTVFEVGSIVLPSKVASVGKVEKMVQAQKVQMAFKGIDLVKGISKTKAFAKVAGIIEKADILNKLNKLKYADDIIKGIKNVPSSVATKIDKVVKEVKKIPEKIGNIEVPVSVRVLTTDYFGAMGVDIKTAKLCEIFDGIPKRTGGAGGTGKKNVNEIVEEVSESVDDIPRISEIEVSFNRNTKHDTAEFKRQLKAQEEGLNNLTVDEYMENRDRYLREGRALEGNAAQKAERERALQEKINELQENGLSWEKAEKEASKWMKSQAALHNPDQIAGGNPLNIGGMGDKRINSSLGSQWKYRIDAMDEKIRDIAAKMNEAERKSTKLNIKLTN